MKIKEHMDLLGRKVTDKVTGFKGVVSSMSFDLYGCIQAVVTPKTTKDGAPRDGRWFDVSRLEISKGEPVMTRPNFDYGPIAEGLQGCETKPARQD